MHEGVRPKGRAARKQGLRWKGRSTVPPTLCPASGPSPASDPDAAAGLGIVSALRAAPSPQPAGATGELGLCPVFPLLHPLPANTGASLTTLPWECSLYPGPDPLGLRSNHLHPSLAPLWLLPHPSRPRSIHDPLCLPPLWDPLLLSGPPRPQLFSVPYQRPASH